MIYKAKNTPPKKRAGKWLWLCITAGIVLLCALILWFLYTLGYFGMNNNTADNNSAAAPNAASFTTGTLNQRYVVVIDPGHGGADPGALPKDESVTEAAINQEIAQAIIDKLNNHSNDIQIVLSTDGLQTLSAAERAAMAMEHYADLLISLHLNSDRYESSRGFQCYVPPPAWTYHNESMQLAELICEKASQKTELPLLGKAGGIYYAFYEETSPGRYRKDTVDAYWYLFQAQRNSETFGVLERCGCPAVLIEQWFISSPEDMALMYTPEGIDAMADIIYESICQYFSIEAGNEE